MIILGRPFVILSWCRANNGDDVGLSYHSSVLSTNSFFGGKKMGHRLRDIPTRGEFVTLKSFADDISCGITTARKIATEAGAVFHIGRNARVNRKKAFEYIEKQAAAAI